MPDFRDVLYQKYFLTQAGRRIADSESQIIKGHWEQLIHEILPIMPRDKTSRILDIGCGFGSFIMLLNYEGYSNTEGIDISADQVNKAHELGVNNVIVADVFDFLNARDKEFDVITGIDIIEHFSKDELLRLVHLIQKALKPNGMAIFRTPNMDAPLTSTYAWGDYTHQCLLNYSSARQLFLASGFDDVEVKNSYIYVDGAAKELVRKICWAILKLRLKLTLFASGKSSQQVLFTPNLLIKVKNSHL